MTKMNNEGIEERVQNRNPFNRCYQHAGSLIFKYEKKEKQKGCYGTGFVEKEVFPLVVKISYTSGLLY